MIPFILGGIALAATGYGVKKYLEDESNCEKVGNTICDFIDKAEEKTDVFFNYANKKIDEFDEKRNGKSDNPKNVKNDETIPKINLSLMNNHLSFFSEVDKRKSIDNNISIDCTNDTFIQFEQAMFSLHSNSLKDLKIALSEIKNLDKDIDMSDYIIDKSKYNLIKINNEIIESFKRYTEIINNVQIYIESLLDRVDTIIVTSDNFLQYSQEDKKIIDKLINLCDIIHNLKSQEIILGNSGISREIKRAFGKLDGIVN